MLTVSTFVRRLLAKQGFELNRIRRDLSPTVSAYLRQIQSAATEDLVVVCLDNETVIQADILDVVPDKRATFFFPLGAGLNGSELRDVSFPKEPKGRFAVVVDIEEFPVEKMFSMFPWFRRAEALLLRTRLGTCWTGEIDYCHLAICVKHYGYYIADVIERSRLSSIQAPAERVIFVCERGIGEPSQPATARRRTIEARTFLSVPIALRSDLKILAGRGSFGYLAGVFNPGAIEHGGVTYLLPRGDQVPWALQKSDQSLFFASPRPLLLKLDQDSRVTNAAELFVANGPDPATHRLEDFRLFNVHQSVFSNHAVISRTGMRPGDHSRLRLEALSTRVGISRLDIATKQLTWCGFPAIDRPLMRTEKNWVMFSHGDHVLLLYSFTPYVLLVARKWPDLNFSALIKAQGRLPIEGDEIPLRNSINPVDYDESHWLHVVHRVYPEKQYTFWGVLLDKRSLCPVRITRRPLMRGWHSSSTSITYTCAAIADASDVRFFSGLDDSATAVTRIERRRLDSEWIPITFNLG
jgi:hypothetical protein